MIISVINHTNGPLGDEQAEERIKIELHGKKARRAVRYQRLGVKPGTIKARA